MGGSGSGRYYRWRKKTIVEDCRSLDANRWMREGILRAGLVRHGTWQWTYANGESSAIGYTADTTGPEPPEVRLQYTFTQTKETLDYRIRLQVTYPHIGGVRWWFTCPLTVEGVACNRRVAKLYLPPGGRHFACRHCHQLTYKSAQEHDKRVDFYRRNPGLARDILRNMQAVPLGQVMLAIKAMG